MGCRSALDSPRDLGSVELTIRNSVETHHLVFLNNSRPTEIAVNINSISFVSTVVGTISVLGVCVYGAVRFFLAKRFFGAIGILALIPLWFGIQILLIAMFDKLKSQGIVTRAYHLDYAVTPLINLVAAGLVLFFVIYSVKRLSQRQASEADNTSQAETNHGLLAWVLEPRKMLGLLFIALGTAAMSAFFVISGALFVIVGVSLLMDVRIWRR